MAAKIVGFRTDFRFVPLNMLDICWPGFGIKLSNGFRARAEGEGECLTMFSKHSLSVLIPNLGSPIMAKIKSGTYMSRQKWHLVNICFKNGKLIVQKFLYCEGVINIHVYSPLSSKHPSLNKYPHWIWMFKIHSTCKPTIFKKKKNSHNVHVHKCMWHDYSRFLVKIKKKLV